MATTIGFNIFAHDKASGVFARVSTSVNSLAKVAGVGLLALGGAAVTAGGFMAKMGIQTAAANEQAMISFTTMLGSGKKAQVFLSQLQKFAAETPFEFPELQKAASSLISAGINANKVIPIMRTLGDVTSGMGTGSEGVQRATIALQQMNAAGKITGEDLNQLRDAGIPVYDLLSKATGKSKAEVVKLAQAGKLGQKELGQMMKALETGAGLERFSGLMDKQSQSLAGLWSTMKDTFGQGLAKAIQPAIPLLKQGLGAAATYLAQIMPKVAAGIGTFVKGIQDGTGVGGKFRTVIVTIGSAIAGFVSDFANGAGAAGKLRTVLTALGVAFMAVAGFIGHNLDVIVPLVAVAYTAIQAFRLVTTAIRLWGIAQLFLNGTLVANPIGLVIAAIAILVGAIIIAYKRSQQFRDIVASAFAVVKIAALGLALQAVIAFRFLLGTWLTVAAGIVHGAALAFGWVPKLGDKLRTADRAVTGFKDSVNSTLSRVQRKLEIQVNTAKGEYAASRLAAKLHQLQSRSITIAVNYRVTAGRIWDGTKFVNVGLRAAGGPVRRGHPYIVGEHGPELIYPKGDGVVMDAKNTAAALAGGNGRTVAATNGGAEILQPVVLQVDSGVLWRGLLKYSREQGIQIVTA